MPPQKSTPVTYYAMILDMIGGPREFNSHNVYTEDFALFPDPQTNYVFTDDSILTMAVARTIRLFRDMDDKTILHNAVVNIKSFVNQYPQGTFTGDYGPKFLQWAVRPGTKTMQEESPNALQSCGNGSAMRVSSVGWAYGSLEKTLQVAKLTALTSHADPEGIKGAQAIASAVYLARAGASKEDIKAYIEANFDYNLDQTLTEIRRHNKDDLKNQSEVCPTTVPMAICAFLASDNFVDCGRKAISIGGDSDTIGAMAGSIAGAFFGMPKWLERECDRRLNYHMKREADEYQKFVNSVDNTPNQEEIEMALANARVEQYAFRQCRTKATTQPKTDEAYKELLAERESVRLFYEEVNKARKKNDSETVRALKEKKADFLAQIKTYVLGSKDFQKQCDKMTKWPGKTVKVPDYDQAKRPGYVPDSPKVFFDVIRLDKTQVPVNMVKATSALKNLLKPMTNQAKADLAKKDMLLVSASRLIAENPLEDKQTEAFYQDIIDKMIADGGDIATKFSENKPELLNGILENLKKMKEEAALGNNYSGKVGVDIQDTKEATDQLGKLDPVKLGEKAIKQMKELSEALIREAIKADALSIPSEYAKLLQQIVSLQKLSNAVEAWRQAPGKDLTAEKAREEALKIPETMDDLNRRYDKTEKSFQRSLQGRLQSDQTGFKTMTYFTHIAVTAVLSDDTGALFTDENQRAMLGKVASELAAKHPDAAMKTLETLSNSLDEKIMEREDIPENDLLMKQVSHLRHLMSAVDDVISAPADQLVDAQYDKYIREHRAQKIDPNVDHSPESVRYEETLKLHARLEDRIQAIGITMKSLEEEAKDEKKTEDEKKTLEKQYDLATLAQGALRKIRDAVGDGAIHQNEKAFSALKEDGRTEFATYVLHQAIRANVTYIKTVPGQKSELLDNFEKKDIATSINEIKDSAAFKAFEQSLTFDTLAAALKTPNGLLNEYMNFVEREKLLQPAPAEAEVAAQADAAQVPEAEGAVQEAGEGQPAADGAVQQPGVPG